MYVYSIYIYIYTRICVRGCISVSADVCGHSTDEEPNCGDSQVCLLCFVMVQCGDTAASV